MQTNHQPLILRHDADFDNAILFQSKISVWQRGQCVEPCGTIERFTGTSVIIKKGSASNCDSYYLRELSEFRTL